LIAENLHLEGVCLQFAFWPGGQIQKANSGYLLPELGRWANHLANQFAISCAVGWVLANGKWQDLVIIILSQVKICFLPFDQCGISCYHGIVF
jgi:hypothetical protein